MEHEVVVIKQSMPPIQIAPGGGDRTTGGHAGRQAGLESAGRISPQQIEALVKGLNDAVKIIGTKLSFSVDGSTRRTVVKVVNAETNEVIRQIPPDEVLRMAQRIDELMGMLFDGAA